MLIDRNSRPWIAASGLALAGAVAAYVTQRARPGGPTGGSWVGLGLGAAGSAMILLCMLLSVRKALRRAAGFGRAHGWMQAHVWFGVVSYPVIWLHAGWRTGGLLTAALMVVFTVVWASGVVGLILQVTIPRRVGRDVPSATIYEQIGHVVARLRAQAEALVDQAAAVLAGGPRGSAGVAGTAAGSAGPAGVAVAGRESGAAAVATLRSYFGTRVAPLLADHPVPPLRPKAAAARLSSDFAGLAGQMPDPVRPLLAELEAVVRERLQLERQRRLHRALHGWLLVHVPTSYLLVVLAAAHAVGALPYAAALGPAGH